jgi:hypothetical protein
MNSPPAGKPTSPDLAVNQECRIPLLAAQYAALDASGRKLFTVSRDKAIKGIAAGYFVPVGRTCVKYLRIDSAADPRRSERYSGPKTWIGPLNPGVGAPTVYSHNPPACIAWGPDPMTGQLHVGQLGIQRRTRTYSD